MRDDPPRNPSLDLVIGLCGLWLSAGFLWDSWAHLQLMPMGVPRPRIGL